jgi:hypothetical protein
MFCKDTGCILASVATAAVKRHRLIFGKGVYCDLRVCALKDINIEMSARNLTFSMLCCRTHIQNGHL